MLLFTLGIVLWILIPFYDKEKESGRRARIAHYFGLLPCLLCWPRPRLGIGRFGKKVTSYERSAFSYAAGIRAQARSN